MKKACMAWRRLIGAVAMGVAMLLVPVAASAHGAVGHTAAPGAVTAADQHALDQHEADCLNHGATPAGDNRLHCHLSSLPAMTVGVKVSVNHDPAGVYALATRVFVAREIHTQRAPAAHIPIAAVPSFILFGNFRS
jgi:hypothetical protein